MVDGSKDRVDWQVLNLLGAFYQSVPALAIGLIGETLSVPHNFILQVLEVVQGPLQDVVSVRQAGLGVATLHKVVHVLHAYLVLVILFVAVVAARILARCWRLRGCTISFP